MRTAILCSTSAIGLCLFTYVLPVAGQADTAASIEFVPLVQPCIDEPSVDTCAEVRAVISECADELEAASCSVLFNDADEVFETVDKTREAQEILQETRDAMPQFPMLETDGLSREALEAARADAERTFLRGDENTMTHSQPELQEGELDEATRDTVEDNDSPAD